MNNTILSRIVTLGVCAVSLALPGFAQGTPKATPSPAAKPKMATTKKAMTTKKPVVKKAAVKKMPASKMTPAKPSDKKMDPKMGSKMDKMATPPAKKP